MFDIIFTKITTPTTEEITHDIKDGSAEVALHYGLLSIVIGLLIGIVVLNDKEVITSDLMGSLLLGYFALIYYGRKRSFNDAMKKEIEGGWIQSILVGFSLLTLFCVGGIIAYALSADKRYIVNQLLTMFTLSFLLSSTIIFYLLIFLRLEKKKRLFYVFSLIGIVASLVVSIPLVYTLYH